VPVEDVEIRRVPDVDRVRQRREAAVTGLGRMDAVALRLGGVHEVRPADVRRGLAHQGVVELGLRTYLPDVASIAPP
jgi:hypothetical protein